MLGKTNIPAVFTHRQITRALGDLSKSIEKLSSGERINRAGDDAANLAVSERMRTQIRGLRQAEQNAQNGLSFIQVAEGYLSQINDILQRIRELAVQSANGIYSEQDRIQIQLEVSQLIDEIDRISTTAEFNRLKILTGRFSRASRLASLFFHVGPNQNQRIRAYISTMNSSSLGLKEQNRKADVLTATQANRTIGVVDNALDKLNQQRANLGGYYNRMEITIRALQVGYENLLAADARIRDTDMAEELIEFTKNQILLQSSLAMLAQANLSTQAVLTVIERL